MRRAPNKLLHATALRNAAREQWRYAFRMEASLKILSLIAILITLSGCLKDSRCEDMHLTEVGQANRIIVSDSQNREIATITEAERVAAIQAFVLAQREGWKVGIAGTPVAMLRANFYRDGEFLGDFGVGSDFATARGCELKAYRSISPAERAEVMSLLGAPDPYEKG
jgi:hypothetical protein